MLLFLSGVGGFLIVFGAVLTLAAFVRLGFRHVAKKLEPDRSFNDGDKLTDREEAIFKKMSCPDCGAVLWQGPMGGMSVNYKCSRERCGSRFNYMGPFGVEDLARVS
jgi:hypothetical protein